jgi:alanine racemase
MYSETRRAAWVEINLEHIRQNFRALKQLVGGSRIIAAVKADAYGHGAVKTAWELVKEGTDYLGVATIEEAVELRRAGMRIPIVLLSAAPRENVKDILDLNLIPTVTTFEDARRLSDMAVNLQSSRRPEIFIALETGMGRLGFLDDEDNLQQIQAIAALPLLKIHGISSHFAASEEQDSTYSLAQIKRFLSFRSRLMDAGINPPIATMANSGAVIAYPQAHFDAVRPGLSLYGLYPAPTVNNGQLSLKPAMSLKANIVYLRKVPPGASISYGRKFTTGRESLIATLPLGYADGLPRSLNGRGRILVGGQYASIVGNICMDQCMADVTDIPGVREYDEVVVLGNQMEKTITAEEIAGLVSSINYEIVCRFGQRLPKVFR